jgi:hypothetical protein
MACQSVLGDPVSVLFATQSNRRAGCDAGGSGRRRDDAAAAARLHIRQEALDRQKCCGRVAVYRRVQVDLIAKVLEGRHVTAMYPNRSTFLGQAGRDAGTDPA